MNQPQSPMQMAALTMLLIAAMMLNLPSNSAPATASLSHTADPNYQFGLIAVGAASMISGLSAALTQLALQAGNGGGKTRSSFFLSAELAVYGILFLTGNLLLNSDLKPGQGLFSNWDLLTWIPVTTSVSFSFAAFFVGVDSLCPRH